MQDARSRCEFEADFTKQVDEEPLGEYTGYYTPASPKPIARVKAITHRNGAYFQGLLTGVPPTESHILKQFPFEASFLAMATNSSRSLPYQGWQEYDFPELRNRPAQP